MMKKSVNVRRNVKTTAAIAQMLRDESARRNCSTPIKALPDCVADNRLRSLQKQSGIATTQRKRKAPVVRRNIYRESSKRARVAAEDTSAAQHRQLSSAVASESQRSSKNNDTGDSDAHAKLIADLRQSGKTSVRAITQDILSIAGNTAETRKLLEQASERAMTKSDTAQWRNRVCDIVKQYLHCLCFHAERYRKALPRDNDSESATTSATTDHDASRNVVSVSADSFFIEAMRAIDMIGSYEGTQPISWVNQFVFNIIGLGVAKWLEKEFHNDLHLFLLFIAQESQSDTLIHNVNVVEIANQCLEASPEPRAYVKQLNDLRTRLRATKASNQPDQAATFGSPVRAAATTVVAGSVHRQSTKESLADAGRVDLAFSADQSARSCQPVPSLSARTLQNDVRNVPATLVVASTSLSVGLSSQAKIVKNVSRVDSGVSNVCRRDPRQLFAAPPPPNDADQQSGILRAHSKVAYRHSALDALCDLDF